MRKIWQWLLTAIVGMTFMLISPPLLSQAREITQATGLDEASAVIKDADGNILSHDAVLPESSEYTVNYNWSIPNGVLVLSGDTMTVHVPTNVKIPADDRFTMTNTSSGKAIGTFFIAAGSHTGTVTLNSTFTFYPLNRQGYIHLAVTGTEPDAPTPAPTPTTPITMAKTGDWADPTTQTHINWGINVLADGQLLTDPVITDTLSTNQTYVAGSAKLTDKSGNVTAIEPVISGSVLTFKTSGSFGDQLTLTYQTTTNPPTGTAVFTNQADYTDSSGHSSSASATVERIDSSATENPDNEDDVPSTTEPEQPGTTEPEAPSTVEPEQPGTTEPEAPSTVEPEQPGTTEPEAPSTVEPEQPGTTEPVAPGTVAPEQPGATESGNDRPSSSSQPGSGSATGTAVTPPTTSSQSEPTSGTSTAPTAPAEPSTQPGGATGTLPLTPVFESGTSSQTPAPASGAQSTLPLTATSALPTLTGQTGQTPATLPQTNEQATKSLVWLGLALLGLTLTLAVGLIRRRRS